MNRILKIVIVCMVCCIGNTSTAQVFALDSAKSFLTKKTAGQVEQLLVGMWSFVEMTTPSGKYIDSIVAGDLESNELTIPEAAIRPDYFFDKKNKYVQKDFDSTSTGYWRYDMHDKSVVLNLDKPFDPYTILDSNAIKMFEDLNIRPKRITEKLLFISAINDEKLVLLEFCQACIGYKYMYVKYDRKKSK